MSRVKLTIHGRVQGVFFRQSTREMAERLGLTGWARNCPDGCVLAVFEGEMQSVEAAITWCRQGPPAASVSNLHIEWQEFLDEFSDFSIRY